MNYEVPWYLKNGHIQSIYPTLFRKVDASFLSSERIETEDDDFLDLEWGKVGSKKLVIVSHGLEGKALSAYSVGFAKAVNDAGIDALLWNYRSCSGTMNRQLRYYHSGATCDLEAVIDHAIQKRHYEEIILCGMSLGGNITLVYAGQKGSNIPVQIKKVAAFSVPCDLEGCADELTKLHNRIYLKRFLFRLKTKITAKQKMFNEISLEGLNKIKTLTEFANRYTAPIHGFKDAKDYYSQCSSRYFILNIRVPTLIVSALDDPFLSDTCYPYQEAEQNPVVTLETPQYGGHLGFMNPNSDKYWSEERLLAFING